MTVTSEFFRQVGQGTPVCADVYACSGISEQRFLLTLKTGEPLGGTQTAVYLDAKGAMALADLLNDVAEWIMQSQARAQEAKEQAARDQIAAGERPAEMLRGTSADRGEFDAQAMRMVRGVAA